LYFACVRLVLWLVPGRLVLAGSALTPQPPAAAATAQQPNRVFVDNLQSEELAGP